MASRLTRPSRTAVALIVCAGTLAALLIGIRPVLAGGSGPTQGCQLAQPQPAAPLELNTVPVSVGPTDFAKSVAMEKEIFHCVGPPGNKMVRDVETFIEVLERRVGISMIPLPTKVYQAACQKVYPAGTVSCTKQSVPLLPPRPDTLRECLPLGDSLQPASPVRMNTVVIGQHRLVKTVKVEKEIWRCPGQNYDLSDVYLFTELIERPGQFTPQFRTLGVVCHKATVEGTLKDCVQVQFV